MFPYACAIFLSAFLLFQVQPLISKVILPWFGGAANVWTTCMLFFQLVLLAGYAYAHLLKQFRLRTQGMVHTALLALGAVFCYVIPGDAWKPTGDTNPTLGILKLLLGTVGVPYFILSTTGPLLQSWFAAAHPGRSPYRLYSLSNVGSLLALVSFPTFFETVFAKKQLGAIWAGGFVVFALLAAFLAWRVQQADAGSQPVEAALPDDGPEPPFGNVLLWLLLPAAASALLLAGTNQMLLDVAAVPFLFIMPLALYLVSFIICFDNEAWYVRPVWGLAFLAMLYPTKLVLEEGVSADIAWQIVVYNAIIFLGCMVCHGELAKLKPAPRHLTAYFLMISLGGAVGGFMVGILAPMLFVTYAEFPIALGAALVFFVAAALRHLQAPEAAGGEHGGKFLAAGVGLVVGAVLTRGNAFDADNLWTVLMIAGGLVALAGWAGRDRAATWLVTIVGVAGLCFLGRAGYEKYTEKEPGVLWRGRNFYGALVVRKYAASEEEGAHYSLSHGRIEHGMQFVDPKKKRFHTSYYGADSGLGIAIARHPRTLELGKDRKLRVGTIGLGTGTTATFCEKGDYFCFYDINALVPLVADGTLLNRASGKREQFFTHLKDAPEPVPVFLGDARIAMERQLQPGENAKQDFDVLAVDAFSGDAIPAHLITKECVEVYLKHFRNPNEGILAVHISNRYLRLERICRKLGLELNLKARKITNSKSKEEGVSTSTWVLLTRNKKFLADKFVIDASEDWDEGDEPLEKVWTDDYCNLVGVIDGNLIDRDWPTLAGWRDGAAEAWKRWRQAPEPPKDEKAQAEEEKAKAKEAKEKAKRYLKDADDALLGKP